MYEEMKDLPMKKSNSRPKVENTKKGRLKKDKKIIIGTKFITVAMTYLPTNMRQRYATIFVETRLERCGREVEA